MMRKRIIAAAGGLSRLLLPDSCALCGSSVAGGHFCKDCRAELPRVEIACKRCGKPLHLPESAASHCSDCQLHPPPFEKACVPLLYAFPIDSALKALKFRRQLFYAPAFGELLVPLMEESFPDVDALLPVPLHPRRHALRGFNQAAELCRPLRRKSGLPLVGNVRRIRFTKPQTGLDAAERRHNMKAAFGVTGPLDFRHPLIVDDVITTGETCRRLAATLLVAGAERVSVLAVARAVPP
jgi:ComF family protein